MTDSIKKVLIVDDDRINLLQLKKILEKDYNILTASNGIDALKILKEGVSNQVSAVILDIIMPGMNGYAVLKTMREDIDLAQIPVLAVSCQENSDDKELKTLSLGAIDYVTKPYNPLIIKYRLSNIIYLHETSNYIYQVQHDSLTGLYNQKGFFKAVHERLIKTNDKYDMICSDIKKFKLVDDLYGAEIGDKLLIHCAEVFQSAMPKNTLIGRIGPDIFACLVPHRTDYKESLFAKLNEQINKSDIELNIVVHYGIYIIEDNNIKVGTICDRANIAIQTIKNRYDVFYKIYDSSIRESMVQERDIISHMYDALKNEEFVVYFQPKYDIRLEKIIGTEALVRWIHPEKGFILPGVFIPIFEKNGFISALDKFVWEKVCKNLRHWIDEGHEVIPCSVNVSRADLYNPTIDEFFQKILKKYNLLPKYIHLEITESAYTENSQQMIDTIMKFKKIGFVIEMDDFGTGYSSLNMLSDLQIDILKLDLRFMNNQNKNNNRSILSFVISLAKWLGLKVIAEGVETIEQVDFLRSLGCEYAQGFYYSRPLPQDLFESLLLKQFPKAQEEILENSQPNVYYLNWIVFVDKVGDDYHQLQESFPEYSVKRCDSLKELKLIPSKEVSIKVVFAVVSNLSNEEFIGISEYCSKSMKLFFPIVDRDFDLTRIASIPFTDSVRKPHLTSIIAKRVLHDVSSNEEELIAKNDSMQQAIFDIKMKAEQDSLTGLLNRAEFENKVNNYFSTSVNSPGIFIMIDIDNFKQLNDESGHLSGDKALISVANALRNLFQDSFIGRLGGDEFAVVITHNYDSNLLNKNLSIVCQSLTQYNHAIGVTCSAGIAFAPLQGNTFQKLYKNADIALLHAKNKGKSMYVFFEDGMETPIDEKLEKQALKLLDNADESMFVSDAITSEIIYINDTACSLIHRNKSDCIGARCYQVFWDRCHKCDRCGAIDDANSEFYEEAILLKDGVTSIQLKAKLDNWDHRKVKVHFLSVIKNDKNGLK